MDKSVGKRIPLIKQITDTQVCNLAHVSSLVGYY